MIDYSALTKQLRGFRTIISTGVKMFDPTDKSMPYTDYDFNYAELLGNFHAVRSLLGKRRPAAMIAPPPPPATPPPPPKSLADILDAADAAPGATSIAAVPPQPVSGDYALLAQVQLSDALISVLTAVELHNRHPESYNIAQPSETAEFTQALANARNYVLSGGVLKTISRYMGTPNSTTQQKRISTTTATIHLDLLTTLFEAFNFPAATLTELEAVLTSLAKSLKDLKLSFKTQTQTLDHFVSYYYFKSVPASTDLRTVSMRLFFLHVDQSSWKVAVGKASAANFTFNMNYIDIDTTMNASQVASHSASRNQVIDTLLSGEDATIKRLRQKISGVTAPPQP